MKKFSTRYLLWSVLIGPTLLLVAQVTAAPTASEDQIFKKAALLYAEHRKACESVECNYSMSINSTVRECRFARDHEKFYHAGVYRYPGGGFGMADEVAWDGQRGYHRAQLNYLTISSEKERAATSCPTPEAGLHQFVEEALGFATKPGRPFQLTTASETTFDGEPCVELKFAVEWFPGTFVVRLAKDLGYSPVSATMSKNSGNVTYELGPVAYQRIAADGNELFYPLTITSKSDPASETPNIIHFQVDPKTLKVNQPIAPSRFRLTAWPSEEVYDWDKSLSTPAANPSWDPTGRVDFPFDIVTSALAAQASATTAAGPSAMASGGPPAMHYFWSLPRICLSVGGAILVGGLTWKLWPNRRSL